jgi:thioredoxin 1
VDIDMLSDLAMDSGIEAVPTVIAFKDGQQVDKFVGLLDEDRLSSFIQKLHS